MARKLQEAPYKKKNYENIQWINITINNPMSFTRFVSVFYLMMDLAALPVDLYSVKRQGD